VIIEIAGLQKIKKSSQTDSITAFDYLHSGIETPESSRSLIPPCLITRLFGPQDIRSFLKAKKIHSGGIRHYA